MKHNNWLTQTLIVILIGITAWLWQGVDNQLKVINQRLKSLELNQVKILTTLGIEPVAIKTKPLAAPPEAEILPESPLGRLSAGINEPKKALFALPAGAALRYDSPGPGSPAE